MTFSKKLKSYSQHGEDDIIWKFFDKKKTGLIVEVGAFDGIHLSNSLALENLGWETVCIEPHPKYFDLLVKNRPLAKCFNVAAVGSSIQKTVAFHAEDLGLLSGIQMDLEDVKQRYENRGLEFKEPEVVEVKARTLNSIFSELGVESNEIDCIFIDTEGSEIDVLKGLDLAYYNPECLVVEANSSVSEKILIDYLSQYPNYVYARKNGPNMFFIKNEKMKNEKMKKTKIDCHPAIQKHPLGKEYTIQSTMPIENRSWIRIIKNKVKFLKEKFFLIF